jgi:hypothetical protein
VAFVVTGLFREFSDTPENDGATTGASPTL